MRNKIINSIENTEHIYYNVNILKKEGELKEPAQFSINLNNSILDTPKDYFLTVARFNIDGNDLPLIIMPILGGINQTDPNKSSLAISFNWVPEESSFFQPLEYVQDSSNIEVPKPPSKNPPNYTQVASEYYFIYSYYKLVDLVNKAFEDGFNGIKTNFPQIPHTEPPKMIYDINTGLFSIIVEREYITNQNLQVFFNSKMINFFNSFRTKFFSENDPFGKDEQILFYDEPFFKNAYLPYGINPPPSVQYPNNVNPPYYSIFTQEYKSLSKMHSLNSIIFTTETLPVVQEYLQVNNLIDDGSTSSISVITDFIPDLENQGNPRSNFIYNPLAQYRLIDLKGNMDIRRINLRIFWTDELNNLYPFIISSKGKISVKLLFIKKEMYIKNNYNINELKNINFK